ncbi:MAG: nucleotidyltransferase family protein, partial [Deltaproteobacteria bacterium]|nr:nucleotidyltransferase family protein [Deltaproteobacteria bacterium]
MTNEQEAMLIVLCGRLFLGTAQDAEALALLRSPLDWPHLCQRAAEVGMSGIVASQLQRLERMHNLDLPLEPFSQTLHGVFRHSGTLLAFLSALSGTLRQKGLQVILLKGGALIKTVYREQPGLRPLGDLDLLVRAEDLPGGEEVLRLHGFRPLV